jgi:polyisoprenyl-teichoic acid--peptidoglycan teichoic acid transferase
VKPRARSLALLAGCIVLCGVLLGSAAGAVWLVLGSPTPASGAAWFQVTKVSSNYTGAPTEPFFFLALGNDGRTDEVKGLGDAIHVIGINPALKQGTMLNVPRDTTSPGGDKINASHSLRGLPGIIEELNEMMGIQITYAMTTNFPGFIQMVNDLEGIEVDIPMPLDDPDGSGAWFETPGTQKVTGDQALAFARDRHDFNGGDIDRSYNQGTIILSALRTLQANGDDEPTDVFRNIAILAAHVQTENLSLGELFKLGRMAMGMDPAAIKNITIPVGSGEGTNLQVQPSAQALFADFRDDAVLQTAG